MSKIIGFGDVDFVAHALWERPFVNFYLNVGHPDVGQIATYMTFGPYTQLETTRYGTIDVRLTMGIVPGGHVFTIMNLRELTFVRISEAHSGLVPFHAGLEKAVACFFNRVVDSLEKVLAKRGLPIPEEMLELERLHGDAVGLRLRVPGDQ